MNGMAVQDAWVKALTEERQGAGQRSNEKIAQASREAAEAMQWLRKVLPECCDEHGTPHPAFRGAVSTLVYAVGRGNVRRDMVTQRIRRLRPDVYAEIYEQEPAAC